MAPYSAGKIRYFALDGNHPVIVRHRSLGGQAIFVRDNTIIVAEGPQEDVFLSLNGVPLTRGGGSRSTWRTPWPRLPPRWP